MVKLTNIRWHGDEIRCHGECGGSNTLSFDLVVSFPSFEVKALDIPPCFETGMARSRIRALVKKFGIENLPTQAVSAWG